MNTIVYINRLRPYLLGSIKNATIRHYSKPISIRNNWNKSDSLLFKYPAPKLALNLKNEASTLSAYTRKPPAREPHSKLWIVERIFAVGTLAMFVQMFITPCEELELAASFCISIHTFWGLEAMFVDYLRPSVFGSFIPAIAIPLAGFIAISLFGNLYWTAVHGNGIVKSIKQLWYLDKTIDPYTAKVK